MSPRDTRTATLAEIVGFLDEYLDVDRFPDYPNALNGLQVDGPEQVGRFAVAVDASEAVIEAARDWADLLIVHHGLFWGGLQPLTGPHFRRIGLLVESGTAVYSAHLPLDGHPEVGNAAVLARKLGFASLEPFGEYQGTHIGCRGTLEATPLADLAAALSVLTGDRVRTLPGGADTVTRVGIVTGGGASRLHEAAARELDVLITGEASHHHAIEAVELGVSVLLGGHYATEVWGVKAVMDLLENRFGIEGRFVDSPTGL
ncbi:MAG: Nif3-like dinuclear metal center hexameric protein [Gemmatimonadetes bacterium]|nr:Nif3-like dinuclear metal center hexameric protein [Gemmatimonadota bacterium]MYH53058.1 Nif3-like dinuclear metal center hexameric protein [Gemmatimonadota bacterium]MYK67934.1 Nif3-like dinuclear metal center hexameric protein [Gemmatimonadota bacterium]